MISVPTWNTLVAGRWLLEVIPTTALLDTDTDRRGVPRRISRLDRDRREISGRPRR
jgi:hypothetical protein